MRITLLAITASGLALTAASPLALAQGVPPPPPVPPTTDAAPAAVFDPQQFPAVRGEIERLTLTARGDIDGFILKDGTEVKTAPALSTQIAYAIKRGDRVTVHGLKAAALPLVSAVSITDEATHRTVTDSGVAAPISRSPSTPLRRAPPQSPGVTSETSGKVHMALHGPQGEVNGLLLESGTILRFPPDPRFQLATLTQPRQAVVAEGTSITNVLGTVVDVQQIGPSRDQLAAVGAPLRPMDDGGPAGVRRRRPPLADGAPQPPGAASGPGVPPPPAPPAP
jgi:hypothetical protein